MPFLRGSTQEKWSFEISVSAKEKPQMTKGTRESVKAAEMTRWCNNRNVLHLRFAHFQRVIDSANSQRSELLRLLNS